MLTTMIIEIARTITALQEALRAEAQKTARLRVERIRVDHELEQLKDLTRRQALTIGYLMKEQNGESLAAENAALRVEINHLIKKLSGAVDHVGKAS